MKLQTVIIYECWENSVFNVSMAHVMTNIGFLAYPFYVLS